MKRTKANTAKTRKPKTVRKPKSIKEIDKEMSQCLAELGGIRGTSCYPLLMGTASIRPKLVDELYDNLSGDYSDCRRLDVIVDSSGGDIDAAYNLALLFRRYGSEELVFIVPRWAKSAATLLACAGDQILMTPVAELGPIDPQITAMNPLEKRVEQFSPLHIESTLQLIRDEYDSANIKLAEGLVQRLQFPLTLGSFKKSIDVGEEYARKLLSSRMLKGDQETAKGIARRLTTGYADHSYCITIEEAREIGLKAEEVSDEQLALVWKLHKLHEAKEEIQLKKRQEKIKEQIKGLPPGLLESLPLDLLGRDEDIPSTTQQLPDGRPAHKK